jgi:THO complex subunit 2
MVIGRFLLGVLTDLWKWHEDEQAYLQDNRTKIGGKTIWLPGMRPRWINKSSISEEDIVSWASFKNDFLRKWHRKLLRCFVDCIDTGEFMHVYNTIIVLKEILPVFPVAAVDEIGGLHLEAAMNKFIQQEERGDLKILGNSLVISLTLMLLFSCRTTGTSQISRNGKSFGDQRRR